MLRSPTFLQDEALAPLLQYDHGFLKQEGELLFDRTNNWFNLIPLDAEDADAVVIDADREHERIVILDAERTFKTEESRVPLRNVLSALADTLKDYNQALSYVSGFLLTTMEQKKVFHLLRHIATNEKYIPGYWRHEAISFARDARVFAKIMATVNPEVSAHLVKMCIWPETYCQKWFNGLCVHVLPFEVLFKFFEHFLREGYTFSFRFGLSLVNKLKDRLLATTNIAEIYALLRLDPKYVDKETCDAIVEEALTIDLSPFDIPAMRSEAQAALDISLAEVKRRQEEQKRLDEEEGSDDSFNSDEDEDDDEGTCGICKDLMPEVHCKSCDLDICSRCHDRKKGTHDASHKVTDL